MRIPKIVNSFMISNGIFQTFFYYCFAIELIEYKIIFMLMCFINKIPNGNTNMVNVGNKYYD